MNKLLWTVLPVFTLSIGVALADQQAKESPETSVVFSDPNKVIMVNSAQPRFTITLKSNPTTGYRWVIGHFDSHLVRLLGQRYHAANTNRIGAPGYITVDFRVKRTAFIASRKIKIVFEYIRPWEAAAKDGQRQTFTVVTTPKN